MADSIRGILKTEGKRGGVLRDPAKLLRPRSDDVRVPAALIQKFDLCDGAAVVGPVRGAGRNLELADVETICGLKPEDFKFRTPYKDLIAIDPVDRFHLSAAGNLSMRVVDLVAPIGKGTRSLIVSPPKAGKTTILEQIANAIYAERPETRIIVLLVDERPEEVTTFRRAVKAEVFASSNDQTVAEHVELTELTLAHIRTELECGRDVVVLLDSLTRMGRAFNLGGGGNGHRGTMSGGLAAGALEVPRRFFGMARNVENGGSVTIVGTCLVDTGSRMDQIIFEEFKGTGNSEIVLDRSLAEARIWPAIDIAASGTRKEERLYSAEEYPHLVAMRRGLAGLKPRESIDTLLRLLSKHATNEEFLAGIPIKAQP
jgi:transcription termination factor Rho